MITADLLRSALRALAYQAPDMAADGVDVLAASLLAHLPGADVTMWLTYREAYNAVYALQHEPDADPYRYLDVPVGQYHPDTVREMASEAWVEHWTAAEDALLALLPQPVGEPV
jgi:hypothetical protein